MKTIVIGVGGMHCQKCVQSVSSALQALPGVGPVEVSLPAQAASITYDPTLASRGDFSKAIEEAGFDAS